MEIRKKCAKPRPSGLNELNGCGAINGGNRRFQEVNFIIGIA